MSETITLMKSHTSVRRFKEEAIPQEDLNEILSAAQMASSWKNFQSYSVIVVRSQEKKDALFELVPQEAIRQSAAFLLFVGDLNRAEKGARLHTDTFQPQGVEGLLITSVDAALAGQNTLLAAESLGYVQESQNKIGNFSKKTPFVQQSRFHLSVLEKSLAP